MAERPVFYTQDCAPFYQTENVAFTYYSGFAVSQKHKSIRSLHEEYLRSHPSDNILEISSRSEEKLGYLLSAFNLCLNTKNGPIHIENLFQAGKKFSNGGPYTDLLLKTPAEAKKDERLKSSGPLVSFYLGEERFGLEPKDYFYNWIYSKAMYEALDDFKEIFKYSAFTDIEFNPEKSINCQAKTVAIFVGLQKAGLLDEAMASKESYLKIVYESSEQIEYTQMSLF